MDENIKIKSKVKAGFLAIFLGFLGIHNFYLGYKKKAIIQLIIGGIFFILGSVGLVLGLICAIFGVLMSIGTLMIGFVLFAPLIEIAFVGCAFYIGCIPTMVWGWVDAILIFSGKISTDAKGNLLK